MAKEMMITFIYDTEMLQKEEDDPASAILYFHPTWVSDQQKTALCGQIIGTIQCLKSVIAKPKIVSLQSGKFFIIENNRYLLTVGTDRNIPDWLLEHRATLLLSLINFFHKDFVSLADIYANSESLSAKMYHLMETYLKMLVFGSNLFSHVPSISLPKSASNLFTEAIHVLECCQNLNNVLGGTLLYHNKVVATQLSPDLTKKLVLSDPYRIKCPAETPELQFDLPLGVQLLQVYITNKEFCSLLESSTRNRNIFQYLCNKSIRKATSMSNMKISQPDPIVSTMKRDQSLLFTAVPEDETLDQTQTFVPTTKKQRPKFLNLKSISIDNSNETKAIKSTVTTPFCGQTSISSTPMTELKRFIHQNPLSICLSNVEETENHFESPKKLDSVEIEVKWKEFVQKFAPYLNENHSSNKKCCSLANLTIFDMFANKSKTRTITDPNYPIFKADGTVVSTFYFEKVEKLPEIQKETKLFENFDTTNEKVKEISKEEVKLRELNHTNKFSQEKRKSLTLPLKSLSTDSDQIASPIINRKYSTGVQLTPLMSKLSMLAFEERSSGFCSRETTPCDYRGLTPLQPNFQFPKYVTQKELKHVRTQDESRLEKCLLFVCGQQDVVMLLLLREECSSSSEVINKLFELCTEELGKLEKQLHYCMESQSGGLARESEPYSYLHLDSEWDTLERGGPWSGCDQGTLPSFHRDFKQATNLTEILLRGSDAVTYGYQCGQTEIFYQESATTSAGLPPPSDLIGLIQTKVKRKLERDHAIILL